jgi:cytochrome P450
MSQLTMAVRFAAQLYKQRASIAYYGYVKRDNLALLNLKPGRTDPYPYYEKIRARGPLVPSPTGNWVTSSYRVCQEVLRDRRFGAGDPDGGTTLPRPEDKPPSFLELNPPDHTRLRRLATPAFSPRAVASYGPRIEKRVTELLDQALATGGPVDFVSQFAAPLPIAVITDLLGIPDSDTERFTRIGMVIGSALDGIQGMRHAAALQAASDELDALFQDLFELRRKEPADDVVSHLVAAEGEQIQPEEMVPTCVLLLVAGFETTVNLIGNGAQALISHPDQWQILKEDPEGMAAKAVDEVLRYDSPVQLTGRYALEDVELEGKAVRRGKMVNTLLAGANHDPGVYPDPARFDITRQDPAPHMSFSSGIHYCLGQPLAKLEGTIAFRLLAERVNRIELAGPVKPRVRTIIRGPLSLPVSLN